MATGFNTQNGNGKYRLQFETDNKEHYLRMQETARRCVDGAPVTNVDRIRAMTDEELAKWLVRKTVCQASAWSEPSYLNFLTGSDDTRESAINGTAEWLKQPAEGER